MQLTRRALWRISGLAGLLGTIRWRVLSAKGLQWDAQPDPSGAFIRTYLADARIVLLSVTVFRRAGVGGGRVTWSENANFRLLDFTGYSIPERAAGLNRFGFIRELMRKGADDKESIYLGLMTASPEESAADARKALHKEAGDQLYTVIEGRMAPGDVETVTSHFTAPARLSVAHRKELLDMARQSLSAALRKQPEFDPRTGPQLTFLQALARLLQEPSRDHTRYVYNARLYDLWLRRSRDSKATAYFRGKGLIAQDAAVARAQGRLCHEKGGKETNFQIWVEEGVRPLPLRIEFQPKSYLRLTFEAEEATRG